MAGKAQDRMHVLKGQSANDGSLGTVEGTFLLARINLARNSASIAEEVKAALALTKTRKMWEMSFTRESRTLAIRRHDAYRDEVVETVNVKHIERQAVIDPDLTSKKLYKEIVATEAIKGVAREVTRVTSIWEVEDRNDWINFPEVFVFATAREAISLHSSLLAQLTEREDLLDCDDVVPHLPVLLASHYKSVACTADPVAPQVPKKEKDEYVDIDSLKSMAVAQRSGGGSSRSALKILALDLYRRGERNIRSISQATGLARDTIYLLLYAEGLKDFPLSHVVLDLREEITSKVSQNGMPAPSVGEISDRWNISRKDADKVLAILRASDIIRAVPGRGAVINKPES
ncbi:hypothetical protein [Streptosporangium sp. NPDC004631]